MSNQGEKTMLQLAKYWRPQERQQTEKQTRQSLAWLGQAVSGVLLIVIVLLHLYFHHFAAQGLLDANEGVTHVSSPLIFILEILFVIVVTYHALLGIRAVIFDLSLSEAARRNISIGLTILGVVTAGYGVTLAILIRSYVF
jgi:succinate dehydrogenase hydrophobic anchor subunit